MDFSYSEDEEALRDLARKILEEQITNDRLQELERDDAWIDRKVWGDLAKANLIGAALPESAGGSGFGFNALALLCQEVGRAVAPVPLLPTAVLGALPIARFGSAEQQARWLPGVASGETILTGALVEARNADPTAPTTTATPQGDGWRLDGEKTCVPVAHLAAAIVVPARHSEDAVGLFLVEPDADGVSLERQETTNREPQFELRLDGVEVPADAALADPTAARWLADRATIAYCATQLGVTERMLRMTADYTAERQQFNRQIGAFQAVHQRAADAYIAVEALRLSVLEAIYQLEQESDATEAIHTAKYWASEPAYSRVAFACNHLHGGIGITVEYPLHRYYRWIKQIELTLGSATQHLAALGRAMADAPPRGDRWGASA